MNNNSQQRKTTEPQHRREAVENLKTFILHNPRKTVRLVSPNKTPMYDEIYEAGVEMLERN